MGLEDPQAIDMVLFSRQGDLKLVITDRSQTEDADQRYRLLVRKLRRYAAYASSTTLAREYPESSLDQVSICILCLRPPSEKMRAIQDIEVPEQGGLRLPVAFQPFASQF